MASERNDGGPAYPGEQGHDPEHGWNETWDPGMSMRQRYKLVVMAEIMREALKLPDQPTVFDDVAQASAAFADALLAEDAAWAKGQEEKSDA